MYNVIQLFIKYGGHILFVVLEIICFYLVINYNKPQRDIYINSSNVYVGKIQSKAAQVTNYISLQDQNDSLMRENANLIENLIAIEYVNDQIPKADSIYDQYDLIPTTICNSTIHLTNNHITLCSGSREGIEKDMGVISADKGIIGVVRNTSDKYAHVITLLNKSSRVSCAIKSRKGHGSLRWRNMDPRRVTLIDVPKHEKIAVGDTVITSGYSTMFPRGILVGTIESYEIASGSNNYAIIVKLFNDLTNIKYAYVIQNRYAAEQSKLEAEVKIEENE
jgi:rod shape-determining protein MreC